jgi:hypothetical protein
MHSKKQVNYSMKSPPNTWSLDTTSYFNNASNLKSAPNTWESEGGAPRWSMAGEMWCKDGGRHYIKIEHCIKFDMQLFEFDHEINFLHKHVAVATSCTSLDSGRVEDDNLLLTC